ncbi:uncharacterized protein PHACADRAFT_204111 [Phanerochaete carnosa HHB-10118-sp]|uniref:Conidiation protein 6 n=1 Tax=Phanerochaete carnosa (strain HHB-10118-sp) TaxID=650164 RepID=K5XD70_PHACS|nr:uncharacterized protein PHACADRAFT_204111 [Phanerochaete carnosa HHB-10118-sp]EKM60967.1 hypothetical protein PHACADRAFT_204111 [Phanerochaete carnosa HHB-10118-sp]
MSANAGNVARGLKAAVSNPNNSEEAKERAQQRLNDMEASGEVGSTEAHMAQVKQGHKANLNNPNTSEESKQHSKQVVDQE